MEARTMSYLIPQRAPGITNMFFYCLKDWKEVTSWIFHSHKNVLYS